MGKPKQATAKKVAVAKCVCVGRCECGVRPERPSHGHVWDAEKQGWVGRGAKESRVASKLTDKGPITAKDGIKVETWQKLPSTLLTEWCQREKRPRPHWHPARLPPNNEKGVRSRCVVPDKKKPGTEHDLKFSPAESFPSENLAKEHAALLALFHTQPGLPLDRKLPDPFGGLWKNLTGADKPKNKFEAKAAERKAAAIGKTHTVVGSTAEARSEFLKRVNDDDPAAAADLVKQKRAETPLPPPPTLTMDSKYASRAEADRCRRAREAEANTKRNKREARERANRDAVVFMGDRVRRDICALLGIVTEEDTTGGDEEEDTIANIEDEESRQAAARVVSLGFQPSRALLAVKKTAHKKEEENKVTEMLKWLCLNTPDDELPDSFDPRGANLDVFIPKKQQAPPKKPKTTTFGGLSKEDFQAKATQLFEEGGLSIEAAQAAALWTTLLATTLPSKSDASSADETEMEVEALEATMTDLTVKKLPGFGMRLEHLKGIVLLVPLAYPQKAPAACFLPTAPASVNARLALLARDRFEAQEPALYDLFEAANDPLLLVPEEETKTVLKKKAAVVRQPPLINAPLPTQQQRRGGRRTTMSWWEKPPRVDSNNQKSTLMMKLQREGLPAYKARAEVLDALARNQVVLVEGGTGCGKTTQIPQMILDEAKARGEGVKVVVAQPRRIAAIGVSSRVAQERGQSEAGQSVGVMVRGESKCSDSTSILFCTTGVLLQRLKADPQLQEITHLVVDEVHERQLDADLLLALLRLVLPSRPKMRLILMSATMDTSKFAAYFADLPNFGGGGKKYPHNKCPVISIPGFAFPVEVFYQEDLHQLGGGFPREEEDEEAELLKKKKPKKQQPEYPVLPPMVDVQWVTKVIVALARKELAQEGAVLVFCSGAFEIGRIAQELQERHFDFIVPCQLHGALSAKEQQRAFEKAPKGKCKVVVSTNVAETSITISDVTAVLDLCRAKETGFDAQRGLPCLTEQWIAKDAAKQRAGRAGRVRKGQCWRLVTKRFFEQKMREHSLAEVHRVSLEGLVMQVLSMGPVNISSEQQQPDSVEAFTQTLLDAPTHEAVSAAVQSLEALDAMKQDRLTALGQHLARLPCAARLGKLLVLGATLGPETRTQTLTIAAALSGRSPWRGGPEFRDRADATKKRLREESQCGRSDHALLALSYEEFASRQGQSARRRYCQDSGLAYESLSEMDTLRRQFDLALADCGFHGGCASGSQAERLPGSAALWKVCRALITAALYPQLLRIEKPSQRYAETAGGALGVDSHSRELRFMRRAASGSNVDRVFLHPTSVNFAERSWPSPWCVYHDCLTTTKTFVRDCSEASPYALLLFCGKKVEPRPLEKTILIDGWIRFTAGAKIALLVASLREALDDLLRAKADDPSLETHRTPVVNAITRLLLHDGLA